MIKSFLVPLLLLGTIHARENPFFPSKGEKDITYTSNEDRTLPKLQRATITLPPHARVLKKVTIEYKSLDGSLESKSIELEKFVDWHLPIFISQSYTQSENNNALPNKDIKKVKKEEFKNLGEIKFAKFYSKDKIFKITTTDKMIRNFLLVQPHRIVMDFEKDSSLKTYIKTIKNSIFTKIRVGNHEGYYRVVVELDGYYRYKLKVIDNSYIITLR